MGLVTGVFCVYQLGEKELFEIWTVSEHGRVGQRRSEEGHIVPGGHTDLIPERAIIIKISHNRSLKMSILPNLIIKTLKYHIPNVGSVGLDHLYDDVGV